MQPYEHIICALDVDSVDRALTLVEELQEEVGVFKVGLELINSSGVEILTLLRQAGAKQIFYDAKLLDIPNTVAGAMRAIVRLGVWCVTVHTMGGPAMLRAAVQAAHAEADAQGLPRPKILGVTVLTSIDAETLRDDLRVAMPLDQYVIFLAEAALAAGCDGVICSPREIETIRSATASSPEFLIITPGVRSAGDAKGDQARVLTPAEATVRGANYLVIGRAINAAPDPVAAARRIAAEIAGAWNLV